MNKEQVTEWVQKISGIWEGFVPKNIFSADETGPFFICASKVKNAVVVKPQKRDINWLALFLT